MLKIQENKADKGGGKLVTMDRRLYVTADGNKAVEEGDPAGRFLLCTPGKRILRSELKRLGVKLAPAKEVKAEKAEAKKATKAKKKEA